MKTDDTSRPDGTRTDQPSAGGDAVGVPSSAGFGCFVRHGGRDADYEGVVEKITRTGYAARITKGPSEHVGKLRHFSRGCWAFLPLPNTKISRDGA